MLTFTTPQWVMLAKCRCESIAKLTALSAPDAYLPRLLLCCGRKSHRLDSLLLLFLLLLELFGVGIHTWFGVALDLILLGVVEVLCKEKRVVSRQDL